MRSIQRHGLLIIMLAAGAFLYAQEEIPAEDKAIVPAQEESNTAPQQPVHISAFKIVPHYYGLPVSVQFGWFYRKENFSIFPNIGFAFLVDDEPVLNASTGFTLRKGAVFWEAAALYDIVPFTMHKTPADQVAYGTSVFSFTFPNVKLSLPVRVGRQRRNEIIESSSGAYTISEKRTVTEFSAGIRADFFLTDLGFFKSTGTAVLRYHWIPHGRFHYYTLSADIPASFHLYHVDIAFMYSFFHTGTVQYGKTAALRRYETAKPQHYLTGRNSFKPTVTYTGIHIFSSELRWYPARLTAETNGFFLSLFADAGIGITGQRKRSLIAEFGGGLGYTLFDSVPFTFQAGVNQNMQPIFYLGVVSRLTHRP